MCLTVDVTQSADGPQAMDYFDRIQNRLEGREAGVPGWLGAKNATRQFAAQIGIRTPEQLFKGPLSDLERFDFPERCIVKPGFASTSIGVHLLERRGADLWDLVKDEPVTVPGLIETLREIEGRYDLSPDAGEFLVEELLSDRRGVTPPADVRCYMFQGECGFVLVEDHIAGPAAASYFNGDFSPMTDVHDRFGVHPGVTHLESIVDAAEPPAGAEELLAVARRVSTAVPSAFCRVDLYDTPAGPVLGEITFYPGTFFYKNRKVMAPEEAARLGKMWDAAEKRLAGSLLIDAPKRN